MSVEGSIDRMYWGSDGKLHAGDDPVQLGHLADVDTTGQSDGQVVYWDSASGKYKLKNESSGGGGASLPVSPKTNGGTITINLPSTAGDVSAPEVFSPSANYNQIALVQSVNVHFDNVAPGEVIEFVVQAIYNSGGISPSGFLEVDHNGDFSVPPDQIAGLHQFANDQGNGGEAHYIVQLNFVAVSEIDGSTAVATIPVHYGICVLESL